MSIARHHHGGYAGAGLFIGGLAWTISTVLGPSYADQSCAKRLMISGALAAVSLGVVIIGALLSWRSSHSLQAIDACPTMPARNARLFLARVSIMAAGLFALAILFQIAASGIFNGCER